MACDAGGVDGPDPSLDPTDVVLVQLAALQREPRRGVAPGAGLAVAWRFASPGNREATGPLERFTIMLRSPVYSGLLAHRSVQLGPLTEIGDQAHQEVLVLTDDDETQGFTWVLGRQDAAPHDGCWMTDGVLRHADRGAG